MSRKATVIASLLLSTLLFWFGLMIYDSVLNLVTGDDFKPLVSTSIEEPFFHKLKWGLSLAFIGATVGFSALLHGQFSKTFNYTNVLFVYFLLGVATGIGWTVHLIYQTMRLNDQASSGLAENLDFSMPLSSIPLHQIGLLVSGTLLLIAITRGLLQNRSQ